MACEVSSRHQGLKGCDPEDLEAAKLKGHCTGNDEYEFGGYEAFTTVNDESWVMW